MGSFLSEVSLLWDSFPYKGKKSGAFQKSENFFTAGTADCLDAGKNLAGLRGYSPQAQIAHPLGFVHVARFPSAPLIDSRPPLINALAPSRLSVSAPAGRIPAGNDGARR
jgi:hypothetical protein